MATTPQNLYICALNQAAAAESEDEIRSAISFAYYAAYHACREFHIALPSPGSVGESKGLHQQLINQLLMPTISKSDPNYGISQGLAKSLRAAMAHRVNANYHLNLEIKTGHLEDTLLHVGIVAQKVQLMEKAA